MQLFHLLSAELLYPPHTNSAHTLLPDSMAGIVLSDPTSQAASLRRTRDRWNNVPIVVAGILWLMPLTMFWIRFFPPVRPFHFVAAVPPLWLVAACVGVCCIPLALPRAYFQSRSFERGNFYPRLGVKRFRRVAPDGDWINRKLQTIDPDYRAIRNRNELKKHIAGTYTNERAHLVLFLTGIFTVAYSVSLHELALPAILMVGNVVFNLYPIMHQRYKRARLRR